MSSKPAKKIIDFKFKLDEALKDYMIKQLDKTRFNPRELRLSENGSCPRKRVLALVFNNPPNDARLKLREGQSYRTLGH